MEDCNRLADITRHYFSNKLAYLEITELIELHHGCSIFLSTLKRWLCQENLLPRTVAEKRSPQRDIVKARAEKLSGCGFNIGYRKCRDIFKSKE